jgi:Uma2 family endonuclease
MASAEPSSPRARLIPVDERLVAPESRYEVLDGRVVYVPPADEEHASRHSKLSALLEAYAGEDHDVASDMLTRTSERDDVAPDASVFPRERRRDTGGRQLEELAFEVLSTERLGAAGEKASKLVARGVRRVFAIDVTRHRAFEWSRALAGWQILAPGTAIEDPVLAVALPIDALVHAAKADDAMARALLAKRNPVLEAALAAREARARTVGKAEAILAVLAARGIEPSGQQRERILATTDAAALDAWLARVADCASVVELLDAR